MEANDPIQWSRHAWAGQISVLVINYAIESSEGELK